MMMTVERNGQQQESIQHVIELHKTSQKRLNHEKLEAQIAKIIAGGLGSNRSVRGWVIKTEEDNKWMTSPRFIGSEYRYACKLFVRCEPKRIRKSENLKQDWANIVTAIGRAGNAPGWEIALIDDKTPKENSGVPRIGVGYVPVEVPSDWRRYVEHIYERDAQIDIIMSCINAAITSEFQDRFHVALIGEPASGKTETLRSLKAALGEDAVMEYDATATTQAGAIKDLGEREELPRILIVEEIEKAPEDSLRWLLAVMDHRAEIRKVNYREQIQKETRLLTLATVNDYKQFKKAMFGALASRFAYHVHFPRPDRALLQKILEREIIRVKGNKRWIKPTLDYADAENICDPRKVTAICLCGRDALLSGAYQKKLKAVSTADFEKAHAAIMAGE